MQSIYYYSKMLFSFFITLIAAFVLFENDTETKKEPNSEESIIVCCNLLPPPVPPRIIIFTQYCDMEIDDINFDKELIKANSKNLENESKNSVNYILQIDSLEKQLSNNLILK